MLVSSSSERPLLSPTPMDRAKPPQLGKDLVPKERYFSRDFARLEWDRLGSRTWQMAGRESDIPEPGDYFTMEIGPESVLCIRQHSSEIEARLNRRTKSRTRRAVRVDPVQTDGESRCTALPHRRVRIPLQPGGRSSERPFLPL